MPNESISLPCSRAKNASDLLFRFFNDLIGVNSSGTLSRSSGDTRPSEGVRVCLPLLRVGVYGSSPLGDIPTGVRERGGGFDASLALAGLGRVPEAFRGTEADRVRSLVSKSGLGGVCSSGPISSTEDRNALTQRNGDQEPCFLELCEPAALLLVVCWAVRARGVGDGLFLRPNILAVSVFGEPKALLLPLLSEPGRRLRLGGEREGLLGMGLGGLTSFPLKNLAMLPETLWCCLFISLYFKGELRVALISSGVLGELPFGLSDRGDRGGDCCGGLD